MREGRPDMAEETLKRARRLPAAQSFDSGILYSLAVLQEKLGRPLDAVTSLREIARLHPEDPTLAEVEMKMGVAFAGAGIPDSALAAFARAEKRWPRRQSALLDAARRGRAGMAPVDEFSRNVAAQARFLASQVLRASGRTDEAVRTLRSVQTDFPRTEPGLRAPLELAAWHRSAHDTTAELAALRAAATEYERVISDLEGSPVARAAVAFAMDRLAEVRGLQGDWRGAADVLVRRAEAFREDGRGSALALLEAARILTTRLDDPAGAERALRNLLDRYPDSPAAQAAQTQLGRPGAEGSGS
jgi:TolA-binding protein